MFYFVLILIAIALAGTYLYMLVTVKMGLVIAGVLIGILLANAIACKAIGGKGYSPTQAQKEELAKAKKMDQDSEQQNAEMKAKKDAAHKKESQERIDGYQAERAKALEELDMHEKALRDLDAVGPDERNVETLTKLVKLMEGRRANSISEALRLYDAETRENEREAAARKRAFEDKKLQMELDRIRRESDMWDQMRRDAALADQNAALIRQGKRIADELEKLNNG